MSRETIILGALSAVLCIAFLSWVLFFSDADPTDVDEPALTGHRPEVAALLESRQKLDETVWAKEIAAQQHEETIIKYWDRMLRPDDDRYAVLAEIPFRTITIDAPEKTEDLDWGIRRTLFGGPSKTLDRDAWRASLKEMQQRGFDIEAIEFHHREFDQDAKGNAISVFDVLLNVTNEEGKHRYALQTKLRVEWTTETDRDGHYVPGDVTVYDTSMLEREGDAVFEHRVLQTDLRQTNLLVYDLNRDGLSDILLPLNNLVMWNRGNAEFEEDVLFSAPGVPPPEAPSAFVVADFDGDGHVDVLCAGVYKNTLGLGLFVPKAGVYLFRGDENGLFSKPGRRVGPTSLNLFDPKCITAGDIDADGDLDLWLAQYKNPYNEGQMPTPFYDANDGYPSYLLLNRGDGTFTDATESSGLGRKRYRRTYAASFVDLDGDRDLDLLVSSDFAGTDIYFNDGSGHFTDASKSALDETANFAMGHTIADYNRDGALDFYVPGMASTTMRRLNQMGLVRSDRPEFLEMRTRMGYGNRMYFAQGQQTFRQPEFKDSVARSGWSWGTTSFDFDSDGDLDIYVANGHVSGKTTKDYCTRFWCHDIYTGDSQSNDVVAELFMSTFQNDMENGMSWDGYQKNHLFMNLSGSGFINVAFLMNVAFGEDSRSVVSDDLDGDGRPDLLITTTHREDVTRRSYNALHLFLNRWPDRNNWIGVRLRTAPGGPSPNGALIRVQSGSGEQIAAVVSGDSYRAQHAPMKLFGLGAEESVEAIEVLWPDGSESVIHRPEIGTYHTIVPLVPR